MTVAAAFKEAGRVYLGADSGVSDEDLILVNSDSKIVQSSEFTAAIAGDLRTRDILEFFDAPTAPMRGVRRYVIQDWVPAFRSALKGAGEDLAQYDTELILVVHKQIFHVDPCFAISEPSIIVIGHGASIALGVLRALRHNGAPGARMKTAILEACTADLYCRPPARVVVL